MRLLIDNEFLEGELNIAQTFRVNSLGQIATRQGSISNSFQVDNTSTNRRLLGFSNDMNEGDRFPYQRIDAQLFDGSTFITTGYIKIESFSDDVFNCAFFSNNSSWFSQIKDKTLKEIDLSDLDHKYFDLQIAASMDNTDGFIYPIIQYGNLPKSNVFEPVNFYPAVYVKTLVERLFREIDFDIAGEMLDMYLYKKMIIPFSGEEFSHSKKWQEDNTITDSLDGASQTLTDDTGSFSDQQVQLASCSCPDVTINETTAYDLTVTLNITANDIIAGSEVSVLLFGGGNYILFNFDDSSVTGQYSIRKRIFLDTSYNDMSFTYEAFVATGPGGTAGTITIDQFDFTLEPILRVYEGSEVQLSETLPAIKQNDFIKYIVNLLGCYPVTDPVQKKVTFNRFSNIKVGVGDAVDWSDKLNIDETQEIDFTRLLSDYGKKSEFKYLEDDDDQELSAYKAANNIQFGAGLLDIDNEHIAQRKDVYEAPFAPSINVMAVDNVLYVPQIRWLETGFSFKEITGASNDSLGTRIDLAENHDLEAGDYVEIEETTNYNGIKLVLETGNDYFIIDSTYFSDQTGKYRKLGNPDEEPKPKILLIETELSFEELTGGEYDELAIQTNRLDSVPFAWFAKAAYVPSVDELTGSLSFGDILFTETIEGTLSKYWKEYKKALSNMKYLKANFLLSAVDIATLDFSRPVYLDHYKALFYLNSVNEFTGGDDLTEVELIKIS